MQLEKCYSVGDDEFVVSQSVTEILLNSLVAGPSPQCVEVAVVPYVNVVWEDHRQQTEVKTRAAHDWIEAAAADDFVRSVWVSREHGHKCDAPQSPESGDRKSWITGGAHLPVGAVAGNATEVSGRIAAQNVMLKLQSKGSNACAI